MILRGFSRGIWIPLWRQRAAILRDGFPELETDGRVLRIRRLPPYVFEQVNRARRRPNPSRYDRPRMGNPDLPTPSHVIEKLKETLGSRADDRLLGVARITGLRKAGCYYARRFGVKLNPETQIVGRSARGGLLPTWRRRSRARRRVLCPIQLSDPCLWISDGPVRDPPSVPSSRRRNSSRRSSAPSSFHPKPLAIVVCYLQSDSLLSRASISTGIWWRSRQSTRSSFCPIWAYAEVYFDDDNRASVLQVPGAIDVRGIYLDVEDFSMAGGDGFAVGTTASSQRWRG